MGDRPFFNSGESASLIDCCIDLALLYKVDPFVMLARAPGEIERIYALTGARLAAMRQDDEES